MGAIIIHQLHSFTAGDARPRLRGDHDGERQHRNWRGNGGHIQPDSLPLSRRKCQGNVLNLPVHGRGADRGNGVSFLCGSVCRGVVN